MSLDDLVRISVLIGVVAGGVFGNLLLTGLDHARRNRARAAWSKAWARPTRA